MNEVQAFVRLMKLCKDDPVRFNAKVLGRVHQSLPEGYWSKQREVLTSVLSHRKTVVPAGHATGKSFLASGSALHFAYTRANSRVFLVAPSYQQLKDVLWAELTSAWRNSRLKLPGRLITSPTLKLEIGDKWSITGCTADTKPENLQGRHAGDMLCVLDECSWEGYDAAIEALESFGANHYLFIGNPLRNGKFQQLCDHADGITTNRINISSLESPHAHLDKSPIGLASKGYIDDMIATYGADHPVFKARVLGLFNEDDIHTLIPSSWLDRCQQPHQPGGAVWIAADLSAGTGQGDLCVLVVRDSNGVLAWDSSPSWDYPEGVATRIKSLADRYHVRPDHVVYDQGGLGAGFDFALRQHGIAGARGYVGGSTGGKYATNFRGAAACAFRDRLNPSINPTPFSIPADLLERLRPEIKELRYELSGGEQIKLERKEDMKKRLRRSPDVLDAMIQAHAF